MFYYVVRAFYVAQLFNSFVGLTIEKLKWSIENTSDNLMFSVNKNLHMVVNKSFALGHLAEVRLI